MTSGRKKILFVAGAVTALVIALMALVVLLVDINVYKSRIEAAASDATGMDFRIKGTMKLALFPRFGFSLGGVSIKRGQMDLLSAKDVRVGLQILPLLRHELRINEFNIIEPTITIKRDGGGARNLDVPERRPERQGLPAALLTMNEVVISNGSLDYRDLSSGAGLQLKGVDLRLSDLLRPDGSQGFIKDISFSGSIRCKILTANGIEATDIKATVKGKKGIFEIDQITMNFAGEGEKASIIADTTRENTVVGLAYTASKLDLGKLLNMVSQTQMKSGTASPRKPGDKTELTGVSLTISNLTAPRGRYLLHGVSFVGDFGCETLGNGDIKFSGVKAVVKGGDGIFDISPFAMDIFGGAGKGAISANLNGNNPVLRIRSTISHFYFERFAAALAKNKALMKGQVDFSIDVVTKGKDFAQMIKGMSGWASLTGDNLALYGLDLDRLLSKVEASQNFSLVDVGAYFLAGPLGALLTKGYDFAGAYREAGGQGMVTKMVSKWKIERGVAEAVDVALSTRKNRVAMKGGLDLVNNRFNNVTVASVDKRGCAKFSQKISGPFRNPSTKKIDVLTSIAGPALGLIKSAQGFVGLGSCRVFYKGIVRHPG
ncbi:MAG TPA: AsmA family protein [Thermodesulfovibrionales bacterium]|nr:AsmA family protein [Thermodesulfovibrionales bacterium]